MICIEKYILRVTICPKHSGYIGITIWCTYLIKIDIESGVVIKLIEFKCTTLKPFYH